MLRVAEEARPEDALAGERLQIGKRAIVEAVEQPSTLVTTARAVDRALENAAERLFSPTESFRGKRSARCASSGRSETLLLALWPGGEGAPFRFLEKDEAAALDAALLKHDETDAERLRQKAAERGGGAREAGTTASFAEEDELYRLAEQRGLETLSAARAEAWQAKAEACRCRLCGGAAPAKLPPRPRCLAVDAPAAPTAPSTQEEREPSDSESASDASDGGGDASDGDDDAAWARKTTLVAEHQELCAEALVEDRCAGWWAGDLGLVSRDVADVAARCGGWATNDAARRPFRAAADLAAALDGTLDLLLSQWALTLFGHNGHKSSPRGAKLLALDLALCAPGNGKAAVLSLALARSRRAAAPEDVVAVTAGAAAAFAGLAAGGDARRTLLEAAHGVAATSFFEGRCGASRRVSATSIEALERHVRAHAPALCADSSGGATAQRARRSAQLSPLAVFCGRAAPRLAARVLGPPADAAVDGDVVYEWGDGDGFDQTTPRAGPARCAASLGVASRVRAPRGARTRPSSSWIWRTRARRRRRSGPSCSSPAASRRRRVARRHAGAGVFLRRAAGAGRRGRTLRRRALEDAVVDALRARDDGAMLRDLRRDERRLRRSRACRPRALRAVEALVARATAARASAVALEALAAAPHWTRSWWSRALPRPTEAAVEADVRSALEAAARDAALGAGDLPPLGDCCRAFLDLDGAAYARETRGGEAAGLRGRLERAVLVELPAILESAGRRR
ncbi:hypothetical protein JL722_2470 [Aureococcus anophagefferens]|nr:hypothetical protein JL722_2470 [Aureococcus anophagefferens]